MNSISGGSGSPSLWQEARNADGRVYYYNTQTKATQWNRPPELMTPAEARMPIYLAVGLADDRAASIVESAVERIYGGGWEEILVRGFLAFYCLDSTAIRYNAETKQSSWEMPEIYKNALAQSLPPSRPIPSQTFVAGGTTSFAQPQQHQNEHANLDRHAGYGHMDMNGTRTGPMAVSPTDPEYASFEEAEAAFLKLLRRAGVQPDWTWEQTMRAIIKDTQYRALKDPKDRKAAFEKFAVEARMQEKERTKERMAKLRADFGTMLRSHPEIKHYTRWKTARPIIEGETIFRSTNDDTERRQLFEEYIIELRKANLERENIMRKAAMDDLVGILRALDLEPYTRWSDAQATIQSHGRFQGDEKFKFLTKSDILTAFESHVKSLERTFNDARQQQKNLKARRERQNRDNFLALLKELRAAGKIKAGTKWMQIHPLIENDETYTAMLGQPGSTPLDLFWDVVEEEERGLRGKRNEVMDVLDDKRYEIQQKTTFDEFLSVMQTDRRTASIDRDALFLIFERLHEKVIRRSEDDKHQAERHQRRAVDALRSKIKHLEPPVGSNDSWDQVRARVQNLEEYRVLESDDFRRIAFDKVIRRLKEKEEDAERDKARRDRERDRDRGDSRPAHRERERERDRDIRNGYANRSARHRESSNRLSRTPEPDAYEADRKKAIADRERQYRKAGASGLSPPHHRSERSDRDRGNSRQASSHYDRERREREEERERMYRSRGDPRGSRDELDYGERSVRRRPRGDSDAESIGRDSKRSRRERTPRERTPSRRLRSKTPPKTAKEEPAVHSGSEEGEIEEE